MNTSVQQIKDNFYYQPTWIIHDVKTFQWLRWNMPNIFKEKDLGGGNILSILGLFPVLNYLSKVYKILESGKLPSLKQDSDPKLYFTEEQAFLRLLKDYPNKLVHPIQNDTNVKVIWKIFRNSLTHIAQISEGNQALVLVQEAKNIPDDLIKNYIKQSIEKSFTSVNEHGFVCFVDKFISDVEEIRDWIINYADADSSKENVDLALNWIKNNNY